MSLDKQIFLDLLDDVSDSTVVLQRVFRYTVGIFLLGTMLLMNIGDNWEFILDQLSYCVEFLAVKS